MRHNTNIQLTFFIINYYSANTFIFHFKDNSRNTSTPNQTKQIETLFKWLPKHFPQ